MFTQATSAPRLTQALEREVGGVALADATEVEPHARRHAHGQRFLVQLDIRAAATRDEDLDRERRLTRHGLERAVVAAAPHRLAEARIETDRCSRPTPRSLWR